MTQLVECVINFSEGRDQKVIDQLVETISSVAGVAVLDQEKDAAHHRSVISFIGSPTAVEEAAVRATGKATELIDLTRHRGEHPRLGATDVIPFVPIRDVTLEDCAAIARRTGERIARQFGIPVYLYEAAATRPGRGNLADIRRGEFERLREEIATNDERIPDFGDRKVHPTAGATVVGAREILVAFNVYLDTEDLSVAKQVAKAVRSSSGGLPWVKALGFAIAERRQSQVSMNLVNYRKTPIFRAFETVKSEAVRRGVRVASSEIVGLVPQAALFAAAGHYLQIENLSDDLVLENRIMKVRESTRVGKPVVDFLGSVSAGEAPPGGGSVAALSVALAAALAILVCKISAGRVEPPGKEADISWIQEQLQRFSDEAVKLVDEDAQVFERLWRATTLQGEEGREEAIQQNVRAAIDTPMQIGVLGHKTLQQIHRLCQVGNRRALGDAGSAAAMAMAGVSAAGCCVAANLESVVETAFREATRARLQWLLKESSKIAAMIHKKMKFD